MWKLGKRSEVDIKIQNFAKKLILSAESDRAIGGQRLKCQGGCKFSSVTTYRINLLNMGLEKIGGRGGGEYTHRFYYHIFGLRSGRGGIFLLSRGGGATPLTPLMPTYTRHTHPMQK